MVSLFSIYSHNSNLANQSEELSALNSNILTYEHSSLNPVTEIRTQLGYLTNCKISEDGLYLYEEYDMSDYFANVWFATICMTSITASNSDASITPVVTISNTNKKVTIKFYRKNVTQGTFQVNVFGQSI